MASAENIAIISLVAGALMALPVLGAAAVARRPRKGWIYLGGLAWGSVAAGMVLSDCMRSIGSGPLSEWAVPVFFVGLVTWPLALTWKQPGWLWRWAGAQALMLLSVLPAWIAAVLGALCMFM